LQSQSIATKSIATTGSQPESQQNCSQIETNSYFAISTWCTEACGLSVKEAPGDGVGGSTIIFGAVPSPVLYLNFLLSFKR